MQLRTKIFILSTSGIILTSLTIVGIVQFQERLLDQQITEELDIQARSECSKIAKNVYLMCRLQEQNSLKKTSTNLNIANELLMHYGVSFSSEAVEWTAINQFTKGSKKIVLPKMFVGGQWLGQNSDPNVPSPFVDKIQSLTGDTCTIFRRMNPEDDMIRVSTNVKQNDGSRAIGTYIPAINPDGTPNPVISTTLRGETYVGRAYVVNTWCIAAYKPILNSQKQIIGLLYVGVKQEDIPELRQGLLEIIAGKSGYAYILGGSGSQKGRYILSARGERDGEDIWDAKDAEERYFIQSIIQKARTTKNGECVFERYPWRNFGEHQARWKVAAVTYYEPWDWVIGVGVYEDDFYDARTRVTYTFQEIVLWSIVGACVALLLYGGIAVLFIRRIAAPLNRVVITMEAVAHGDYTRRMRVTGKKDEIDRMSTAINRAIATTAKIMDDLKETENHHQKSPPK